jgi:hypothetical protein
VLYIRQMKRWFLAILFIFLLVAGGLYVRARFLKERQLAGLQVTSEPRATIFLDGKHLGQTPFKSEQLRSGDFSFKLVPDGELFFPWTQKIKLNPGVLTAIDRQFGQTEEVSSHEILTLESSVNKNLASLAVISSPDGALVKIDGVTHGFTPLSLSDVSEGDHLISISLNGYLEKEVKAKTVLGRRLIINIKLAKEKDDEEETTSIDEEGVEEESEIAYVVIKETETGWLRVRLEPTTAASEAAKVKPGEKYPLLEENKGWYKIPYEEGKEGWISGKYATKFE